MNEWMEDPTQWYAALVEQVGAEALVPAWDAAAYQSVTDKISDYAGLCDWFEQDPENPERITMAQAILAGFFQRPTRCNRRVGELVKSLPWRFRAQKKIGDVEPSVLRWLTVSDARGLSKYLCRNDKRQLLLDSVSELSGEAVACLLSVGVLGLSGLTELTEEVASELGQYSGELLLDGLTSLDPLFAGLLSDSPYTLAGLSMNGLTVLSIHAVLRRESAYMSFGGLTELTDVKVASALAQCHGELKLGGVKRLSGEAAAALAGYPDTLSLDGLTEMSLEAAQGLALHQGALWLEGLEHLSEEAAKALGKKQGTLGLTGLTTLSTRVANGLSTLQSNIWLSNLETLEADAAKALAKIKGCLGLGGLMALSDAAAAGLSTHTGGLRLERLMDIEPAGAASLGRTHGELWLDGLDQLPFEIATGLSGHEGGLSLDHLPEMLPEASVCLGDTLGFLRLDGLNVLPPEVAKGLEKHQGNVSLKAVHTLCEGSAKYLSTIQGDINLTDIRTLEVETALALKYHLGTLALPRLDKANRALLQALRKHKRGPVIIDGATMTLGGIVFLAKRNYSNLMISDKMQSKVEQAKRWVKAE